MEHYAKLVGFSNQEKNQTPAVELKLKSVLNGQVMPLLHKVVTFLSIFPFGALILSKRIDIMCTNIND